METTQIIKDSVVFTLTNLIKQYGWNDLIFNKRPDTIRTLLSLLIYIGDQALYSSVAYKYKYVTGDKDLDQLLYSSGLQLLIGSNVYKDVPAGVSDDIVSLLAVFLFNKIN